MRTIIIYFYLDPICVMAGEGDFNGYVLKFFVTNDNNNKSYLKLLNVVVFFLSHLRNHSL